MSMLSTSSSTVAAATSKTLRLAAVGSLLMLTTFLFVSPLCAVVNAFAPPMTPRSVRKSHYRRTTTSTSTSTTAHYLASSTSTSALFSCSDLVLSQTSLDKLESIKLTLKRPRGASIGVEYAPPSSLPLMSDGDLSSLSMQLRKSSKCASIWTSDVMSIGRFAKEQEGARGDFPGPVPVIYSGVDDLELVAKLVGDESIAAVVVDCNADVEIINMKELLKDVGIIWKVHSANQLQELSEAENSSGGVFLLSSDMLPQCAPPEAEEGDDDGDNNEEELKQVLSALPKSIITIAPLPSMLPTNNEIPLAKHYASLGISSLILEGSCVGDEEDVKYTSWAIESITKKSSSSFSMTGLTGSTNGHFGTSSHVGEVKWRRNSNDE